MFSSRCLTCLSAISVTSRMGRGAETTICMMGVASGSNFCIDRRFAVSGRSGKSVAPYREFPALLRRRSYRAKS